MTDQRADVYDRVTASIVAQLEQGVRPWAKPWAGGSDGGFPPMPIRSNGERYKGVNVLLLWGAAEERGYVQPRWMTFKQALEAGAAVRKGEKGSLVVYANKFTREVEGEEVEIPFMKGYTVFNVEQIDGLAPEYFAHVAPLADGPRPIEAAERFLGGVGADVRHGGGSAFYTPTHDFIQLPPLAAFIDAESYYATRAHETIHWTRHETRLNRDFGRKRWGDEGYAVEELVAEIGAAFLAADLRLYMQPREDHAAYLASWLKVLKGDKRAIFTAASHAQKACDFLHRLAAAEAPAIAA